MLFQFCEGHCRPGLRPLTMVLCLWKALSVPASHTTFPLLCKVCLLLLTGSYRMEKIKVCESRTQCVSPRHSRALSSTAVFPHSWVITLRIQARGRMELIGNSAGPLTRIKSTRIDSPKNSWNRVEVFNMFFMACILARQDRQWCWQDRNNYWPKQVCIFHPWTVLQTPYSGSEPCRRSV